jgi:serine phosphatase RsbU (regulator of sigma subunit)
MGQLRGIIRTIANTISGTPAETLTRTDSTAQTLQVHTLATAIVAQIEREASDQTDGRIALWSNAGHPPPILISQAGLVRTLPTRPDPLLGVHLGVERSDHAVDLHPGDTLLLYTDGLIERPDQDISTGLDRLTESVAGGHRVTLNELADAILDGHDGRQDDIALLLIRIKPDPS